MVTVRWEEKNRAPSWGSWHSFEWISQHAGPQNGRRGGRESPTRHSRREYRGQRYYGAAGSAHLGLARFRGTSTALRILGALPLAQKGAHQPRTFPSRVDESAAGRDAPKFNPAPDSFLLGEGAPKSPHARWDMQVQ